MSVTGVRSIVSGIIPDLGVYESLYKDLHAHPGLSLQEEYAASVAKQKLNHLGYRVIPYIGGHGLVGILENGGPDVHVKRKTVLVRAELDALPLQEQTGLSYASQVTQVDVQDNVEKPVMHACGHDMHIACALAAADSLSRHRHLWAGTLIFLFQPNEERGAGARAMIQDELYDTHRHACPIPDVLIAQHVGPLTAGTVRTRRGAVAASADSIKVSVYGRGGHASMPHKTIDPILLLSHIVVRLQGIVSREIDPATTASLTVAAVHSGEAENVIPSEATLKINIRTWDAETRDEILSSIRRIVNSECAATGCLQPARFEEISRLPLMHNDVKITEALEEGFRHQFGPGRFTSDGEAMLASDDFPVLAEAVDKPYCYWFFGGIDPNKPVHVNHSPLFAPLLEPSLRTGCEALLVAALTLLTRQVTHEPRRGK